ncbi:hypothetical protein KY335_00060 [Candidatus Woesearchaeota archaeon]|nr:hypothetical protein [Candidatus Woesearchaeota archaeon]
MNKKRCEDLIQELRNDFAKNEFVCEVVAKALRSCGIYEARIPPSMMSKVCTYIWDARDIPDHDKKYAVAKVLYGTRL